MNARRVVLRRLLAIGFAVAVVTQAVWVVPYYLVTDGCFCSHQGPIPSWAGPWLVPWVEAGTLPATAVLATTGPGVYVIFNAAFWIAVVLTLGAVAHKLPRRRAPAEQSATRLS
jgi:hypothetical protein